MRLSDLRDRKVRSLDGTRFVTNGINAMLSVIGEAHADRPEAGINTMLTDTGKSIRINTPMCVRFV